MDVAMENLVLQHLRGAVDRLADDRREGKGRLGMLDSQYARLSNWLDRVDERVARMERRLDLRDA